MSPNHPPPTTPNHHPTHPCLASGKDSEPGNYHLPLLKDWVTLALCAAPPFPTSGSGQVQGNLGEGDDLKVALHWDLATCPQNLVGGEDGFTQVNFASASHATDLEVFFFFFFVLLRLLCVFLADVPRADFWL